MRSTISRTLLSASPASRSALRQIGCWRREPIWTTSSVADATPRITLVRAWSASPSRNRPASARTRFAAMSARSWALSVAGIAAGGIPNSIESKRTPSMKPPRLAYVMSGADGSGS